MAHETKDILPIATTREEVLDALQGYINQRTGMDVKNYFSNWGDKEGVKAYRADYRRILNDGKDARTLLRLVELKTSITVADLMSAVDASGRLTFNFDRKKWEYTTGQYWCTEYRAAAVRYLIQVLLNYFEGTRQEKRAKLCKELSNWLGGRRICRDYLI